MSVPVLPRPHVHLIAFRHEQQRLGDERSGANGLSQRRQVEVLDRRMIARNRKFVSFGVPGS